MNNRQVQEHTLQSPPTGISSTYWQKQSGPSALGTYPSPVQGRHSTLASEQHGRNWWLGRSTEWHMALPGIWQVSDLSEAKVATTIKQKTKASIFQCEVFRCYTGYLLRLDIFIMESYHTSVQSPTLFTKKIYRSQDLHQKIQFKMPYQRF